MKFLVRLLGVVAQGQIELEAEDQQGASQAALLMLQQNMVELQNIQPFVVPLVMQVTDIESATEEPLANDPKILILPNDTRQPKEGT